MDRIALDDLTSDQLDQLYDMLAMQEHRADMADSVASAAKTLLARRTTTLRGRAERAEAERDRYRAAWKSARHRAAMYLQSNEKFAASLENSHAAYLQLGARVTELTAGQCTHTRRMCDLHHREPVDGCPYPKCVTAREQAEVAPC